MSITYSPLTPKVPQKQADGDAITPGRALLFAGNSLDKARKLFTGFAKKRPRACLSIRQCKSPTLFLLRFRSHDSAALEAFSRPDYV